jgi:hypothetical protein
VSSQLYAPVVLTPRIGCWMNLRVGLDDVGKRKFLTLPGLQPAASRYTDAFPEIFTLFRLGISEKFCSFWQFPVHISTGFMLAPHKSNVVLELSLWVKLTTRDELKLICQCCPLISSEVVFVVRSKHILLGCLIITLSSNNTHTDTGSTVSVYLLVVLSQL